MAKKKKSSKKCNCNPGWYIVALILWAVGLWGVVSGFTMQFNGLADYTTVIPWYFVGLLLIGLGKMAKWRCFRSCEAHK